MKYNFTGFSQKGCEALNHALDAAENAAECIEVIIAENI